MAVAGIVVPELRISSAIRRMRGEVVMAAFTSGTACRTDADVEARVAARSAGLGMARLAIEQAVGECCSQAFSRRAMIGREEEAAIHSVGQRTTRSEILQVHLQPGITELVGRVVAMAACGVTTPIVLIVLGCGVHLDSTVPMITIGVRGSVEQLVIGGWREAATCCGFLHAVADYADIMQTNACDRAMIDRHGGGVVRGAKRR